MESSTILIVVIINLVINLLSVVDHFLSRIKKSNCCGLQLEMEDQQNDYSNNQFKYIDINELINGLKNINNTNDTTRKVSFSQLDINKKTDIENKV